MRPDLKQLGRTRELAKYARPGHGWGSVLSALLLCGSLLLIEEVPKEWVGMIGVGALMVGWGLDYELRRRLLRSQGRATPRLTNASVRQQALGAIVFAAMAAGSALTTNLANQPTSFILGVMLSIFGILIQAYRPEPSFNLLTCMYWLLLTSSLLDNAFLGISILRILTGVGFVVVVLYILVEQLKRTRFQQLKKEEEYG